MILSHRHVKTNKCRTKLSICLRTVPPKELHYYKSLPWEFRQPGNSSQGRPELTTPDTLSQTNAPLVCSSKGSFLFPRNHLRAPKRPTPPLPCPVFESEIYATSEKCSFFPQYLPCTHEVHTLINFYLFSPANLPSVTRVYELRWVEAGLLFLPCTA